MKLAEFFIQQAKSRKRFIIETHSDLIVMRTIRAILEEHISQGDVGIYFTSLDEIEFEGEKVITSKLEPIEIDKKSGVILNWPPGFMDARERESDELLDIMFSKLREDDE